MNTREERKCGGGTCGPPVPCTSVKCDYVVHPVHKKFTLRVAHPKPVRNWNSWEKRFTETGVEREGHVNHICKFNHERSQCECKCFTEEWAKKYLSEVLW